MTPRVLCAPDKFKQACSALQAAQAIARGVSDAAGLPALLPLADGGEGTLDVLAAAFPRRETVKVRGPLGTPVDAVLGLTADGRRALVESAQACGLWRLDESERDPLKTSTFGVGEMIRHALDAGATEISVGLGGSATSDGGAGMAVALGARILDAEGNDIQPTGGALIKARRLDLSGLDTRLRTVSLSALCDVSTPLLGEQGASRKFVVQKGGTTRALHKLEESLAMLQLASLEAGVKLKGTEPGTGAAGGLGFGVAALLGGKLRHGADAVLDLLDFSRLLGAADLVITGEGSFDHQTAEGKLVAAVAARCHAAGVPLVVLAGVVEPDMNLPGVTAAFGIARFGARKQDNLDETEANLQRHAAHVTRLLASRQA
ncbi:MAG: glycerate kinase [Planctomycetes bacterium]|nr:glycerate kinase [Planctomycetota bacterium]